MAATRNTFSLHRKLGFGVVAAVVLIAFFTLVPLQYDVTVGYQATYSGISPDAKPSMQQLSAAMDALGYDDLSVSISQMKSGLTFDIAGLPSRYAAREVTAVMAALAGFEGTPEVEPMVETHSGSLYAQMTGDPLCDITIDIDEEGKTDEEIKAEIEQKLADQGVFDATVHVSSSTGTNGQQERKVWIGVGDGAEDGPQPDDFDSGNIFEGIDIDDPNMTDAEIEATMEQRLAERGITGSNVTVTTTADGKRKCEIFCKKEVEN